MVEQILPDGGHFERSPMYHATLLEDLLDLVQLGARWLGLVAEPELADWRATARRMLRWLHVMTHPDGGIAFFNDAALGIAPDLAAYKCVVLYSTMGLPVSCVDVVSRNRSRHGSATHRVAVHHANRQHPFGPC